MSVHAGRVALVVWTMLSLAGCAREAAHPRAALIGAWRSHIQFAGGILAAIKNLEFLYAFNEGGTMTESSNYDAAPPVPPAYGEWRAVDARRFEAKYTFYTTSPPSDPKTLAAGGWSPAGFGVLTERITLSEDGRAFDSRIVLEMFDTGGKPVTGGGEATGHGERAGFEAHR